MVDDPERGREVADALGAIFGFVVVVPGEDDADAELDRAMRAEDLEVAEAAELHRSDDLAAAESAARVRE